MTGFKRPAGKKKKKENYFFTNIGCINSDRKQKGFIFMSKEKYVFVVSEISYMHEQKGSFSHPKVYGPFDSLAEAIGVAYLTITEIANNNKENVDVSVERKFSDEGRQYMFVYCTRNGETNLVGHVVPLN